MNSSPSVLREKRAQFILYVLVLYVLFQLCWWGYLLIDNYREMYALNGAWPQDIKDAMLQKKIWMLIGEGGVFIVLIFLGFWYLKRSISRELELARMQKTFMLSVTHELKTPIAAIKLFLETVKTRKLTEEQTSTIVNDALRETKRLQLLSENILLTQQLEGRQDDFMKESINVTDLLNAELTRFENVFNRKFKKEIESELTLKGDKHLLQSLISNIIENALKYSPENSDITVYASQKNDELVLEVRDKGIGIPESEKSRVFQKFYRVGNEETRSHKGTGLGLYIVSNVVRMHNGHIFVTDNTPSGTIVSVVFKNKKIND